MSQWASQNHTIHPSEDCLRRYLETKNTSYFWDQTYSQLWQHKDKDKDVLSLQVHTSRVAVEKAGRSKRPHNSRISTSSEFHQRRQEQLTFIDHLEISQDGTYSIIFLGCLGGEHNTRGSIEGSFGRRNSGVEFVINIHTSKKALADSIRARHIWGWESGTLALACSRDQYLILTEQDREEKITSSQILELTQILPGQRPQDQTHLLQGQGLPKAHTTQGHAIQGGKGTWNHSAKEIRSHLTK